MVERGMVIVGAGECGARAAFALIGQERHLPYERPPLSKGGMAIERPGMKLIAQRVCFERHGIRQVLANEARAIDRAGRTVELADGEHVDYRRLVAASGIGPGNAVARDIRLAEMMIAKRTAPDCAKLSAADVKLKSLLAA